MTMRLRVLCLSGLWVLLSVGCVGEDAAGTGDLQLAVGGGTALQEGFPHDEGGVEIAFVDGWSLQFEKYVVVVADVALRNPESGKVVAEFAGPVALDLKAENLPAQDLNVFENVPAVRLDIAFSFQNATAEVENRNVRPDDLDEMIANGWSYLITGTATKDATTIDFRFGLSVAARYYDCINGKDGTQGIAIESNKRIGAFIYAHALHLFWDTLAAGDEDLRFDAFAAVAGDDGVVTVEELAEQDLTDLRDAHGEPLRDGQGNRVFYNDGGMLPLDQQNLAAFLNYAARAGVHFNGVGLCNLESL
jgi:hypothetical protein